MHKVFATLAFLILADCGSAQKTGPTTTNPPLTSDQLTQHAPKKKSDGVVQDGSVVSFKDLMFKMTLTNSPWSGNLEPQQDGTLRVVMWRSDYKADLQIVPMAAENVTAEQIAEDQRKGAEKDGLTPTAVASEGHGRYAFTVDSANPPESTTRIYLAVMPHPSIKDGYLLLHGKTDPMRADGFIAEIRAIADSIQALQ